MTRSVYQTLSWVLLLRHKLHILSFRGREHSDRRYAPSEHKLRERSPESITTDRPVASGERATAGWGYGFRARRQVGEKPTCRRPGM